ncbi:MAG: DnaA/Hda family protein, partial [Hydrogenophaga sp.]
MKQMALDIGLAPVPTLTNFVPAGNEAALEHLKLWTHNPLRSPVPTFVWGESGSGKTHLLRAVRESLREHGSRVGWIDVDTLDPPEYDEHWDAVLLDDCHLYTA